MLIKTVVCGRPLAADRFPTLDKIIQRNAMLWTNLGEVGIKFESLFPLRKTGPSVQIVRGTFGSIIPTGQTHPLG